MEIGWLAESGITSGCNPPTNDRFCPDVLVTRGQIAKFLVRALGLETSSGLDYFVDDDGSIFEREINSLAHAGITRGCNLPTFDPRFCPERPLTRGEMASLISRSLALQSASADYFVDDDNSVFEDDINRIAKAGVTKGCNPPKSTEFCPSSHLTRGQMAALLHRAFRR